MLKKYIVSFIDTYGDTRYCELLALNKVSAKHTVYKYNFVKQIGKIYE